MLLQALEIELSLATNLILKKKKLFFPSVPVLDISNVP